MRPALFCLPYSGASAMVYGRWRRLLHGIDLQPVEIPGRGRRLDEPVQDDMPALARQLAAEIRDGLQPPYALFGHSLGALLAFEIAHALRDLGCPPPLAVFASGTAAPSRRDDDDLTHEKSDAELIEELRRLDGTPEEVLAHPELMRLTLPVLRADFRMCGRYQYRPRARLDCPIHVLAGREDAATSAQLWAWEEESGPGFSLSLFDGGHFFIAHQEAAVTALLQDRLRPAPSWRQAAVG